MKKYGGTLRRIREQKGLTIQQLAAGILSVSFLSKFERGESDISLRYFTQLLVKLSLTFEEFFYLHDDADPKQLDYFFDKSKEAYVNRDLKKLNQLRDIAHDQYKIHGLESFHCNTIMLNIYENIIRGDRIHSSKDDLKFLYTYLFDVEVWGYYELTLYNSTMYLMPPEMVVTLSKTAFEKSAGFGKLKKFDKVIIPILLNTLTYLMGGATHDSVQYKVFLGYLEGLDIPEEDLYTRTALLQTKGIHEIKTGNQEKGVEMFKKAIAIYNALGSKNLAMTAENYLKIVLDQENQ